MCSVDCVQGEQMPSIFTDSLIREEMTQSFFPGQVSLKGISFYLGSQIPKTSGTESARSFSKTGHMQFLQLREGNSMLLGLIFAWGRPLSPCSFHDLKMFNYFPCGNASVTPLG